MAGQTKLTELNILFNALGCKSPERRYRALLDAKELTPDQLTELAEMATRRGKSSLWLGRTKKALGLLIVFGGLFVSGNTSVDWAILALPFLLALLRPAGEKGTMTDTTNLLRPGMSPEESIALKRS